MPDSAGRAPVSQEISGHGDLWQRFRRKMPVAEKWAYFDHAAVAPIAGPARDALAAWTAEAAAEGDTIWPTWSRRVEETRALAAWLISAESDEVALLPNTTAGINLVAEGFPWQPGDNVVTLDNEFPSNVYPWLNQASRGVETRRVPTDDGRVDLDRLAGACDRRTRLISVSWVGYASGWRVELDRVAEIARGTGALLFVDAIQGLGVFPLDVKQTPIDFLAADGHKWLLGPEGAGVFFIRKEHLPRLRPLSVGWNSVQHAHDFTHIELNLKPTAARYEGGSQNMAGMLALGASLQMLLGYGTAALAQQVLDITDLACRRLEEIGARVASHREGNHRSGIVGFELPGQNPQQVRERCLARGVALGCRAGRLRISPHAYVNADDVERLIAALQGS